MLPRTWRRVEAQVRVVVVLVLALPGAALASTVAGRSEIALRRQREELSKRSSHHDASQCGSTVAEACRGTSWAVVLRQSLRINTRSSQVHSGSYAHGLARS